MQFVFQNILQARLLWGLFWPVIALTAFHQSTSFSEETPDPKALLQGVLSIREQIPPSNLRMRLACATDFSSTDLEQTILFSRERRYFTSTATNYAAPKMLFDGKDVYAFTGNSVIIRNLDTQMADYLFDPRSLGITTAYAWDDSVQRCVHLNAPRIELVGKENINNKSTWHVRMTEQDGEQNDLWIDPRNKFAVYRADQSYPKSGRRTMRSVYENRAYPWLPSQIKGEEYDLKGNVRYKRRIWMLDAKANVNIPEGTWTLTNMMSGVNISSYIDITDARSHTNVGYWHQGRVTQLNSNPLPTPTK